MNKNCNILILTILLVGVLISCTTATDPIFNEPEIGSNTATVRVWVSSADKKQLLQEQATRSFSNSDQQFQNVISINDTVQFQQMDGFGASLTESAGWCLSKLSVTDRDALMQQLFNPKTGIGLSFLRQPMGSPDFALETVSYDDMPTGDDMTLAHFSIDRDRIYILPYLKQALAINPEIKVMASPWSPPAWMKTGRSMIGSKGGVLRPDCYQVYAQYFVRFIQAYEAEGVPIYAISPQNEMDYAPDNYAGMKWTPVEESKFVRDFLEPAFRTAGIKTKIIVWDHNWDGTATVEAMLKDAGTYAAVAGTGWHWYGGSADAMTQIHQKFPQKDIWFTEGGNGVWIGDGSFKSTFKDGMQNALRIVANWSKSVVFWNIALNQNNGPIVFTNSANYGLVQINDTTGVLTTPYRSGFYILGHFAQYIRPGAYYIESAASDSNLVKAAFINSDKSHVLVVYNPLTTSKTVRIRSHGSGFTLELPPESAATCVWQE